MPNLQPPVETQFVGSSNWMDCLRKRIHQIAGFNYGVLISGPSGTGKELVARSIHDTGPRRDRPFIPVNCAAVPASLFSSQLFGHTKGAFTGAQYASLGCFRAAEGGTIFLDEIGELDLDCQAKLLRVLQEKKVTPVGGHDSLAVDVRTIAATNRDLSEEVRAGRFRLDLYYRLNVLSIQTTGLVERLEDIVPLANHFLAKTAIECGLPLKRLDPIAMQLLQSYSWPGNVRELENFIERAVVMADSDTIGPEAFPEILESPTVRSAPMPGGFMPPLELRRNSAPIDVSPPDFSSTTCRAHFAPSAIADELLPADEFSIENWSTLADVERQHIERTLKETFYNQSAAARLLDVDRKLLGRKIRKYKIRLPSATQEKSHRPH